MDRMCFMPYCDRDPQCVSNVLTYTYTSMKCKEISSDNKPGREDLEAYKCFKAGPVIN
ncbi:hypothetical protein Hanom_Chr08g00711341 [Helianthus anomalus]